MTAPRAARAPLMPLDDALDRLGASVKAIGRTEIVDTFDADGRVLAEDIVSALHVPPQDNSSMDGYAVRCADVTAAGVELPVSQRIAAGHAAEVLQPGTVARIFTGAPVPPGADAIVMQEDVTVLDGEPTRVRINVVPNMGDWIRRAGEDVTRGAMVLQAGARLNPAHLGLAASLGRAQLTVSARPRVALFSTGDELVMPGDVPPEAMPPGAIYNSNRFFLRALLQRWGCAVTDLGIVPDNRAATIAALQTAAEAHDLIVTSGGVSVGEEDHVKPAVQQLGALDLWQIAMKPGKPLALGYVNRTGSNGSAVFLGLPGNPVSSWVTAMLMVRPVVLGLQGVPRAKTAIKSIAIVAHFDIAQPDKRREFVRVRRNDAGGLDLFPNQSSGVLTSATWGDGWVDKPAGATITHGDVVAYVPFAELW